MVYTRLEETMSFGDQLRWAREARRLTLDDLASSTKIKRHLLADLEDDDLTRWPKYVVYRRGYVASIAEVLRLDKDDVLDRFDDAFPEYFPVPFDGGRSSFQSRMLPLSVASFKSPVAASVLLAVLAGLALGGLGKWIDPVGPAFRSELSVDHTGRDRILQPEAAASSPANAPLAGTDAVRAVNSGEPSIEGEMRVTSNPPDAIVTVNGIGRGRTPARVRFLPLGSYTVRVIQDGYAAKESRVVLTPDEPVRKVNVSLHARNGPFHRTASH